jgi:hypothetical protein
VIEPTRKRAIAFFDGQNLFHSAKEAFGYSFPNFDPKALALRIAGSEGWDLVGVRSILVCRSLPAILFGITFGPLSSPIWDARVSSDTAGR